MAREAVFDNYTPLDYKQAMASGKSAHRAPTWVGEEHERRLLAYKILQSYDDNASREFRPEGEEGTRNRDDHREYGDASLLNDSVMSALLGESQTIIVPGAEAYDPDAEDPDPDEQSEAREAFELQEWLRGWAEEERLPLKLVENERKAVSLGDAVYTLGWSNAKGRPRLRVFDPGFYFPVLDDRNEDEFPETVHLAWELEPDDPESGRRRIRRITWRLAPIVAAGETPDGETALREGEAVDDEGRITRQLPWNDEPTAVTCYLTDAVWDWDPMGRRKVTDLDPANAEYQVNEDGVELRDLDLMIDFVPVVHVPNTVAQLEHFGRASILKVLQILDDLANADTDVQAASATTGSPPISLSGATFAEGQRLQYKPGEVLETGPEGRLDVLDTSRSLDALLKYINELLSRLSTNSRLPAAILGRLEPSEVPSGIAMALSFGPLRAMIDQMRLVRGEKYPLLLKFAHRLAIGGGQVDVPEVYAPAELELGNYLPEDRAGAIKEVTELLVARAISVETAVRMLQAAGLPIEDATAEVAQIQARMFEAADKLLDATGDEAAVRAFLGLDPAGGTRPEAPPGA